MTLPKKLWLVPSTKVFKGCCRGKVWELTNTVQWECHEHNVSFQRKEANLEKKSFSLLPLAPRRGNCVLLLKNLLLLSTPGCPHVDCQKYFRKTVKQNTGAFQSSCHNSIKILSVFKSKVSTNSEKSPQTLLASICPEKCNTKPVMKDVPFSTLLVFYSN